MRMWDVRSCISNPAPRRASLGVSVLKSCLEATLRHDRCIFGLPNMLSIVPVPALRHGAWRAVVRIGGRSTCATTALESLGGWGVEAWVWGGVCRIDVVGVGSEHKTFFTLG